MSALSALREKLQAAVKGDVNLDHEIFAWAFRWNVPLIGAAYTEWQSDGGNYTRSLSDAFALMDRQWGDAVFWRLWKCLPSEACTHTYAATCGKAGEQEAGFGATRALALCSAMLAYADTQGDNS